MEWFRAAGLLTRRFGRRNVVAVPGRMRTPHWQGPPLNYVPGFREPPARDGGL
jgi:hypothetical protein